MSVKLYKIINWSFVRRYSLIMVIIGVFYFIFNFLYDDIKNRTIDDFNEEQLLLANTAAQGISSFLDRYQSDLDFIAKNEGVIDFSDECKNTMKYFYESNSSEINAITRVDSTGKILYTYPYNESVIGRDISDQAHVKQILSTRHFVLSDVFMSVQGYYTIAMHYPVFKGPKFMGSMAILIPINKLGEMFLDKVGLKKKGHAWLITENFTEIYCRIKGHEGASFLETTSNKQQTIGFIEEIRSKKSGTGRSMHQEIIDSKSKVLESLYVVFQKIPLGDTHWTILISYKESEVYKAISRFRNRLYIVFVVLFIAVTFYIFSLIKVRNIIKEERKRREAEKLLRMSEKAYRESNERFVSFMENTPIYAYIKDSSLNYIYRNKNLDTLLNSGNAQKENSAKDFDEETVKMLNAADKQILSGEKKNFELVYQANFNGNDTWFKVLKFRIKISDDEFAIGGAVFDITEIIKYELELEEHKSNLEKIVKERTEDLEHANLELATLNQELKRQKEEVVLALKELKDTQARLVQSEKMASVATLTSGLSHEINNPLNYLAGTYYGFAKYFKKYGSFEEDKTNLLLSSTDTAINRISTIVRGLNDFSSDDSKYDEPCEIHSIIENCLSIIHSKYKRNVEVTKDFCSHSDRIKGNIGKLHQLFINILNNSFQSIKDSGQISIDTHCHNGSLEVKIADTGSGISKDDLSKITDPFFTTKSPGEGTGLGLSIAYSIIQEHKGTLKFESDLGKGTIAYIYFPIN